MSSTDIAQGSGKYRWLANEVRCRCSAQISGQSCTKHSQHLEASPRFDVVSLLVYWSWCS